MKERMSESPFKAQRDKGWITAEKLVNLKTYRYLLVSPDHGELEPWLLPKNGISLSRLKPTEATS